MPGATGDLEGHIPYVRYLMSVDPGDPAIAAMDAAARRKRIFDAVRAMSIRGGRLRPIVFVVEDLHWIDTSSEEYLGTLLDSVASGRIMLVLTSRLGYTAPFGSRSFFTTITLDSLSEAEAVQMASRVLGASAFPPELRAALLDKAEGVPLFVEEVTKTLLDLGVLRREGDGYRMVRGVEVSVPDTIQGIIMARLDRLGEEGKRTVQLASVIGRQFLHRLLERIAGLTGELEGLLRELKALEIIYEQGLLPEPAYIFKHAVIQDVAYNSLLLQRRKELYRAVGAAIEELYPDRLHEHHEELAHHFAQGEEWQKALAYSVLAGDRAAHAFANLEARDHYTRAVEAAGKLAPPADPRAVAGIRAKLASVLSVLGEYESAASEYEKGRELARQVGDRTLETRMLIGLTLTYNLYHRGEEALAYADDAIALAREIDDPALQAAGLANRVMARSAGYGQLVQATPDAEEALRLAEAVGEPGALAQAHLFCGQNFQWRGDFEGAFAHLRRGLELAQQCQHGFFFGYAAFFLGHAHLATGDYEEALRWYHRMSDYAAAAGDKFWMARAPNVVGGVHLELYDFDEAIALGLEGDEVAQKMFPWPEPRGHSLLKVGLAHLARGEHGLAGDFLARASALLEGDVWFRWRWHIPLLRARGEMTLAEGRLDEAWTYATQSLDMAKQSDSRKHVVRAQRLQGEILAARGQLDAAADALHASVALGSALNTPREVWLGQAALGGVLARLGRDKDAETQLGSAAQTIETILARLVTPRLRESFLGAEPVQAVYRALGRRPPASASSS